MQRRRFLYHTALIAGSSVFNVHQLMGISPELTRHTIDEVEFGTVHYHWPRHVGKNARIGVHGQHKKSTYIRLRTNQGASGWGLARLAGKSESQLRSEVVGLKVSELIDPGNGILNHVSTAFDFSLHDLAGIILGKPVYELLGANGSKANPVYSGMIYFDELEPEENPAGVDQVLQNCQWDYDYGYRQLKVKIGRSGRWYPHAEGLAMDIRSGQNDP